MPVRPLDLRLKCQLGADNAFVDSQTMPGTGSQTYLLEVVTMIQTERLRRRMRLAVSAVPELYLPLASLFSVGEPVRRDTEIVIEGFPRSANSFAEAAFRVSQTRPLRVAHHCHAAAQIVAAHRWAIPCLVIIRTPDEACRSLLMHHPSLFTPRDLFKEYYHFHRAIRAYRNSFVLARFESATTRIPEIVEALNRRFTCNFAVPDCIDDSTVFKEVDRLSRSRGMSAVEGESYSPTRSEQDKTARRNQKELALTQIHSSKHTIEFRRAHDIFESLERTADL